MYGMYFLQSYVVWQLYFHLLTLLSMLQALCSNVHSLGLGVTEASYYFSLWWLVIIDHVIVVYNSNTSIPTLFCLLLICCITCIYLILHFILVTDSFEWTNGNVFPISYSRPQPLTKWHTHTFVIFWYCHPNSFAISF